ncbi:MAG: precorrin-8X methylmutase [Atribacterota bacterium]
MKDYLRDPETIQEESFRIIRARIAEKKFSPVERVIVERVIHATADFSYAENLYFSPDAVESGLAALNKGFLVITDTRMAKAGINRGLLEAMGGEVRCILEEEGVEQLAQKKGITRAMAAMRYVALRVKEAVVLIGNAPTALFTLVELFQEGVFSSPLVIGVPVGLVGAEEAKKALRDTSLPSITTMGPKGGTPVAVAIFHALCHLVLEGKHGRG